MNRRRNELQRLINHTRNAIPPSTPERLLHWLRVILDIEPTDTALIDGNHSPFEYLCHAFFPRATDSAHPEATHSNGSADPGAKSVPNAEGINRSAPPEPGSLPPQDAPPDSLIWASRGGGKTFYAALATLLDLTFKPGIEIKILGGSLDQSARMHEHLARLFENAALQPLLASPITARHIELTNHSTAEILAQSHTSVRGTRPQILRCDEVELFDEDVWQAAQLVTRSKHCGWDEHRRLVHGAVEAFSTCHRPGGLMSKLIADAQETGSRRLFRWTAIDVLEKCPPSRECTPCELLDECAGRAKKREGKGHFRIDDAITMKERSARETWESEMLCNRPSRRTAVFHKFDPAIHVADFKMPTSPLIAGMDFGFRSPTVILWASVDESNVVRILHEHVEKEVLLEQHIRAIMNQPGREAASPGPTGGGVTSLRVTEGAPSAHLKWIAVDPAGNQRSDQTGLSPIALLRRAGVAVKYRKSSIEEGLRLIHTRLAPASGPPTLFIHARCTHLIECMTNYRFSDNEQIATPVKDGHDHAIDALRYMLINLDTRHHTTIHRY